MVEVARSALGPIGPRKPSLNPIQLFDMRALTQQILFDQEMDVAAFWAVQIAAIHAADAYSPLN